MDPMIRKGGARKNKRRHLDDSLAESLPSVDTVSANSVVNSKLAIGDEGEEPELALYAGLKRQGCSKPTAFKVWPMSANIGVPAIVASKGSVRGVVVGTLGSQQRSPLTVIDHVGGQARVWPSGPSGSKWDGLF